MVSSVGVSVGVWVCTLGVGGREGDYIPTSSFCTCMFTVIHAHVPCVQVNAHSCAPRVLHLSGLVLES